MINRKLPQRAAWLVVLFVLLSSGLSISAQTGDDLAAIKKTVGDLMKQNRYTEALPLLEKLVAAEPGNSEIQFYLGFALIGTATNTKEVTARKALRVRARAAFVKAKELDIQEPVVEALISSIPLDGSDGPAFSQNIIANSLMTEAEEFFARGKLDDALKNYRKALELDPKLYHAALFAGDVYTQREDFDAALTWYDRAIAINPNIETGYRYSATPLMKQGKTQAARDRYIEAFITEPYNKFARAGLIQWGATTKTPLAHPDIKVPSDVSYDEKGNAKITLDAGALLNKDDGSFAWIIYGTTRTLWKNEKFAKQFPGEPAYRHSLAEEADALRSVVNLATSRANGKKLESSIAQLKKLNEEGLLEAYILLARPDEGIAEDHPAYLKENRDKLRRYVVNYVVYQGP